MNSGVYAVLVTYNPDINQLKRSISSLLLQVEEVVIVNNSDYEIEVSGISERIIIVENGHNLGIATAQNIGTDLAISRGAKYIVQSDQDSIFPEKMVTMLLSTFNSLIVKGVNVGIVCPNHYDSSNFDFYKRESSTISRIKFENARIVSETLSSGSLLSKEMIEECGKLNDDLFIDIVDWEYCWRARDKGYEVVRLDTVAFAHKAGMDTKKIFGKKIAVIPSPIRHYYHTRNAVFLLKESYVPLKWKYIQVVKILLKPFIIPLFYDHKAYRMNMLFKGFIHGIQGKLGKLNRS